VSALLRVEGLTVTLNGSRAVRGVSLSVREGEVVSIVGPNGSGKSTLLMAIMGLLRPDGGRVIFNGSDVTALPANERARLGIRLVPSEREVFPLMTLRENLLVSWEAGPRKESFGEALERVLEVFPWMRQRLRVKAGNLSGGERRMLAIAMALMSSPRLLLVDEPSSGLSPRAVAAVLGSMRSLEGSGLSVLLAEQNLEVALKLSRRILVMRSGEVLAEREVSDPVAVSALIRSLLWG